MGGGKAITDRAVVRRKKIGVWGRFLGEVLDNPREGCCLPVLNFDPDSSSQTSTFLIALLRAALHRQSLGVWNGSGSITTGCPKVFTAPLVALNWSCIQILKILQPWCSLVRSLFTFLPFVRTEVVPLQFLNQDISSTPCVILGFWCESFVYGGPEFWGLIIW